jgi:hypothetical protein
MSEIIFFSASKKFFFFAEMMCKQLIFCVKAATHLKGQTRIPDMVVSIADQFEILPTIPRRTDRQINRAGHPADNTSQLFCVKAATRLS